MKTDNNTAAICGLFCGTCPQFPEKCHGCLSNKLTGECTVCPNGFRDCAKEHNVTRCYECQAFPCLRLEAFSIKHIKAGIGHHSRVIADLTYMKEHGVDEWVARVTKENTCTKCGELIHWYDKNTHNC